MADCSLPRLYIQVYTDTEELSTLLATPGDSSARKTFESPM